MQAWLGPEHLFLGSSKSSVPPIRLELDLGDEKLAKKHGQKILTEIQRQGFTVGPNGFVMQVVPRVVSSGQSFDVQQFGSGGKVSIPGVNYTWRLLGAAGRSLPSEIPRRLVLGDGRYAAYPQEFKWSAVEGD